MAELENRMVQIMDQQTFEQKMDEATTELNQGVQTLVTEMDGYKTRLHETEMRVARMLQLPYQGERKAYSNTTETLERSESFRGFKAGNLDRAKVEYKSLLTSDVDVRPDRDPTIYAPVERTLTIMDLMPQIPTDSNLVDYTRETAFTNAAAEQVEGADKAESDFTFVNQTAPVTTVAHHVTVSTQAIADRPELQNHIDNRLIYGLAKKIEDLLLNGTGDIEGLLVTGNHVDFNRSQVGDTMLDTILAAMTQLQLSDNQPTGLILNPADWEAIRKLKDTQERYLFGFPSADLPARLWGLPVIATNSINENEFIIGDFQRGAIIRDRQQASIEVSRNHGTNFIKNLATILAETRLAFTVVRPAAIVTGSFGS